jgi:hypothetical protein
MAAGLGFKTFAVGEVLTAANVNGYLMQGVLVFADAAARNAAITSPQEGQFAYTKDTNGLWYYDGAAWVASGAAGDIEGVTAGTGISGGGTSGTVTITNSMATAIDAKGDLIVGTGADTFSRLAVGATNGHVLQVDSAEATGMKWAAAAGGSTQTFTLLNSGGTSLSSTLTTISGLSGYNILRIIITGGSLNGAGDITLRLNGDANSKYSANGNYIESATSYNVVSISVTSQSLDLDSSFSFAYQANASQTFAGGIEVMGANSTGVKPVSIVAGATGVNGNARQITNGIYTGTSVISSFSVRVTGGSSFDAGTVYIYGAN